MPAPDPPAVRCTSPGGAEWDQFLAFAVEPVADAQVPTLAPRARRAKAVDPAQRTMFGQAQDEMFD